MLRYSTFFKKVLGAAPAAALTGTALLASQPAYAVPTCEQEINIRCHGFNVQGRPRLDLDYNSPAECVAAEQPALCGTSPQPYASLYQRPTDVISRQEAKLPA